MGSEDKLLKKARVAKRESKYVEFKERFDVGSTGDWCEIIKDIVAIANSGGGFIIIGVKNNGENSGFDYSDVLKLDPAVVTDKIAKYTGEQYSSFDILEIKRGRNKALAIRVGSVPIPLIFTKPGTYPAEAGKQKTAFSKGTVYFRHGAKSEPGDSNDLRKVIERELRNIRRSWLGGIRKVVKAPAGHKVHVLPPEVRISTEPDATRIRITDEKKAPIFRLESPDVTHPYRQKEVIERFNKELGRRKQINSYDVLCVRRVYRIDGSKPEFCYVPRFTSPQYSDGFVNWLINSFNEEPRFFDKARDENKKTKNNE